MKDRTEAEFALLDQINKLRGELDDIETARAIEQFGPLLGRCFQYRHRGFGGPDHFEYARVTRVQRWPYCFRFETKHGGAIEIKRDELTTLDSWEPISDADFSAAWQECLAEIKAFA